MAKGHQWLTLERQTLYRRRTDAVRLHQQCRKLTHVPGPLKHRHSATADGATNVQRQSWPDKMTRASDEATPDTGPIGTKLCHPGCVGGGSNAAGAFYHFLEEPGVQLIAVEAAGHGIDSGMSAATTQLGKPGILHGSKSLVMQTADGRVVEPHSISAGLDYPGIGPLHAHLYESGRAEFLSATDEEALAAAFELAQLEGIIPALETAHALAVLKQRRFLAKDVVVICLSGRGDKDLATYMNAMKDE